MKRIFIFNMFFFFFQAEDGIRDAQESRGLGDVYKRQQEIVPDDAGEIVLRLPGETAPTTYRVDGWMAGDLTRSSSRVSFYDHIALRPQLGGWQVWKFVNTTGDTHPIHIHQSTFQPLEATAGRLVFQNADQKNLYNPDTRTTSAPLEPETDPANPPRTYEPHEVQGWKEAVSYTHLRAHETP